MAVWRGDGFGDVEGTAVAAGVLLLVCVLVAQPLSLSSAERTTTVLPPVSSCASTLRSRVYVEGEVA